MRFHHNFSGKIFVDIPFSIVNRPSRVLACWKARHANWTRNLHARELIVVTWSIYVYKYIFPPDNLFGNSYIYIDESSPDWSIFFIELSTCYFEPSSEYDMNYLHMYILYLSFALLTLYTLRASDWLFGGWSDIIGGWGMRCYGWLHFVVRGVVIGMIGMLCCGCGHECYRDIYIISISHINVNISRAPM